MRGWLDWRILWLTGAVTMWTAGFDIIYACQDYAYDVSTGLFSIPQRFGSGVALDFQGPARRNAVMPAYARA